MRPPAGLHCGSSPLARFHPSLSTGEVCSRNPRQNQGKCSFLRSAGSQSLARSTIRTVEVYCSPCIQPSRPPAGLRLTVMVARDRPGLSPTMRADADGRIGERQRGIRERSSCPDPPWSYSCEDCVRADGDRFLPAFERSWASENRVPNRVSKVKKHPEAKTRIQASQEAEKHAKLRSRIRHSSYRCEAQLFEPCLIKKHQGRQGDILPPENARQYRSENLRFRHSEKTRRRVFARKA